jgi:phosphopantetheine adenylyltransferase
MGVGAYEPDLEAVILTREVEQGGLMINQARLKNNLQPLDTVFVDMILAEAD